MAHSVFFFKTDSGRSPVAEYIKEAAKRDRSLIIRAIDLLTEMGFELLGTRQVEKVTREIYELRIKGEQLHRLLFFFWTGNGFVLVHAFTKKTPKTPLQEIKTAEIRMKRWLNSE